MNTLILFDAAVKNCGQQFHQLFTSRATMNTLVEIIDDSRTENTVRNRIGSLLKQWMEDPEFKDKAQYAMLGATYKKLTTEKGYTFIDGPNNQSISTVTTSGASAASRKTQDELLAKREEEEFAKASKFSKENILPKKNILFVCF
jgi:cytochrome c1